MNINKYTEKAQEAVLAAQRLAEQMSHAQIEPEHLLLALVEQPEGIVPELFRKMGVEPKPFAAALREDLSRLPQAYGGSSPSMSPQPALVLHESSFRPSFSPTATNFRPPLPSGSLWNSSMRPKPVMTKSG